MTAHKSRGEMRIELAGYEFSSSPISKSGNLFMTSPEGDGTEIDEFVLRAALDRLFKEVM